MSRFDWGVAKARIRMRQRKERRTLERLKKGLAAMALAGAALIFSGAAPCSEQVLVEDSYTVTPDDTLWSIGEAFLVKNTGGRRYILEFIEGIKQLNPELVESRGEVYPGQVLRINYWVSKE